MCRNLATGRQVKCNTAKFRTYDVSSKENDLLNPETLSRAKNAALVDSWVSHLATLKECLKFNDITHASPMVMILAHSQVNIPGTFFVKLTSQSSSSI